MFFKCIALSDVGSANGRPADFGSAYPGSNPGPTGSVISLPILSIDSIDIDEDMLFFMSFYKTLTTGHILSSGFLCAF